MPTDNPGVSSLMILKTFTQNLIIESSFGMAGNDFGGDGVFSNNEQICSSGECNSTINAQAIITMTPNAVSGVKDFIQITANVATTTLGNNANAQIDMNIFGEWDTLTTMDGTPLSSLGVEYTYAGLNSLTAHMADVPEPTTIALMSLGLLGLGFSRRKRI